ncbi:MAG TPA: 50S ribosomal protein L11 methyltransferase [Bacteroidota bacterium]|nr:50S ribosomal protein L11 methyltransferase [Bacteroidota bacterium]
MTRSHVEIAIDADPSHFETLIGIMAVEGFERFWEDGAVLRAYLPEELFSDELLSRLHERLRTVAPATFTVARIREQNWNRQWEETIRPIRATERIIIAPSWHPYQPQAGEITLTIDPKMSFGTGYHETTRLTLHLLEGALAPGARVLDVGTGTGVLAIAAIKLGAGSAIGIDNDEWAYANARENARLNGVRARLEVRLGELSVVSETGFDCIVANIQKNTILAMIPELCLRLGREGKLILSGLLTEEGPPVIAALIARGLKIVEKRSEGEWVALSAAWEPGARMESSR